MPLVKLPPDFAERADIFEPELLVQSHRGLIRQRDSADRGVIPQSSETHQQLTIERRANPSRLQVG